jgi:4-hydroxymandelate oxidase
MLDLESLERRARERLTPEFYDYVAGGSDDEWSLDENERAWDRLVLRPRVLRDVSSVRTDTSFLGTPVSSPIAVAPMAMQHHAWEGGALSTARAAADAGALMAMGLFGAGSAVEIARNTGSAPRWLQVYLLKDRRRSLESVKRIAAEGYSAVILTVDVVRQGNRLRDVRNRWAFMDDSDESAGDPNDIFDHALTFDDLSQICHELDVPVVVKGVLRGDDAAACAEAGAAGVIVSNHGGRQLDGCISPAEALGDVVASVAGRIEVYVDGGIRRGTHVLKALAMGAKGVFVGRPVMWGLAAAGEAGVKEVLDELRIEFERDLALCGVRDPSEIDASLITRAGA